MTSSNRRLWPVLLAAGALAQNPPPPATLEGVILNALTGEPIPSVHFRLQRQGNVPKTYGALTNTEGKFSITGLPPSQYTAQIGKLGFALLNNDGGFIAFVLKSGELKDDVKVKLMPLGAITGRVVDENGDPMPNINVKTEGGSTWPRAARTDDRGYYRIGWLNPGSYRVAARPMFRDLPPEIRTDGTSEVHYARTYYPNALEQKSAAMVEVHAGAETSGLEIRMVRTPIVWVSGRVSGLPAGSGRAQIEARQGQDMAYPSVRARADGTFEFWRLDPGKYRLRAIPGTGGFSSIPLDIEVGESNLDNLELRMIPPADLTGRMEYEDDQAKPPARPRQLSLVSDEGSFGPTEIAQDGSFRLQKVAAGRYRVSISWQNAYVKSLQLGPSVIQSDVVDLRNSSGTAPLTVAVSSATAEISGVVRDARGPVKALVGLSPETLEHWRHPLFTVTRDDGRYVLRGIRPGKYKLVALEPGERFVDLPAFDDHAVAVEVRERDKIDQDLKLVPNSGSRTQ